MRKIKSSMKALGEKVSDATTDMSVKVMLTVKDKTGAALWEYLLVIVIVCILGAGLISVISGPDKGIAALWKELYGKFTELVTKGVEA